MKMYKQLSGVHVENGKTYARGDVVASPFDLAKKYPDKFALVPEMVVVTVPVPEAPKPTVADIVPQAPIANTVIQPEVEADLPTVDEDAADEVLEDEDAEDVAVVEEPKQKRVLKRKVSSKKKVK